MLKKTIDNSKKRRYNKVEARGKIQRLQGKKQCAARIRKVKSNNLTAKQYAARNKRMEASPMEFELDPQYFGRPSQHNL